MKTQTQLILILAVVALVLGAAWYTYPRPGQAPDVPAQALPATIQNDCAPWDGAAFSVSIPLQGGDSLSISIWQAPDLAGPKTFAFPDGTGQVGNASLMRASGFPDELSGSVSFPSVKAGEPVQGTFDLTTQTGQHFSGTFQAEWQEMTLMCG